MLFSYYQSFSHQLDAFSGVPQKWSSLQLFFKFKVRFCRIDVILNINVSSYNVWYKPIILIIVTFILALINRHKHIWYLLSKIHHTCNVNLTTYCMISLIPCMQCFVKCALPRLQHIICVIMLISHACHIFYSIHWIYFCNERSYQPCIAKAPES